MSLTDAPAAAVPAVRSRALDRARGLAVLLMVADHLALFAGADVVRFTAGRLALPLFFIVAGHLLSGRLRVSRLYVVAAAGFVLPLLADWVDSPNVLLWYVLGVYLLTWLPPVGLVVVVVAALTAAANGWDVAPAGSYAPLALVALMAVGRLLPRSAFDVFGRLPAWFELAGRWPLSVYVGHVLAFTLVSSLWSLV